MAQVQIIVVGRHHEVVVILRGLADGAAVQNGLLVDGAVRSLVGRHDCGVFRRVNGRKFRPLGIGQLQILHLCILHGVIILGIIFGGDFPGERIHQGNPILNAVLVALFQLLHAGHGILQLFHRLRGQLCLFLVGKAGIGALIAHDDLVVLGIRQIIGARQSADKIGQLRRGGLDHNHRDGSVDLDLGILFVDTDDVNDRLVLLQRYRLSGKLHHRGSAVIRLLHMHFAVHENLRLHAVQTVSVHCIREFVEADTAHLRGDIHDIVPAACGIAGSSHGVTVLIRLEQRPLGITVEHVLLVKSGGTTENKSAPDIVARLGEGQLVILRAALRGDGDVESGGAAAGKLGGRGGGGAVREVRQHLAVAALELGGGPRGQAGERHGKSAVVILLEVGVIGECAAERGGILVKGQGHGVARGAVLMDGGEGDAVSGEQRARRLQRDGIDLGGSVSVFADLQGDDGADLHGDGVLAAVLRAARINADAVLLVAGGGGHGERRHVRGQNHGVVMHVAGECRDQLARAEGDGLEALVAGVERAADVRAQIAGMLYGDLVARFQLAVGHGVFGEALAGKPVVERAHPTGILRRVLLLDAVDFADVARVRAGLGIALGRERVHDAAHHGGVILEGDPFVHQRPLPRGAVGLGPCGVFHRHMHLTVVVVRRECRDRHERQRHDQCHQQ